MASWVSAGRSVEEFWECSPGQILHVLKALGLIKKKGTAQDFVRMMGAVRGVKGPVRSSE